MNRCGDPMAITDVACSTGRRGSRVSALVDGAPVWFETSDAALTPSGEAFGTAFLIPALSASRPLAIDATVDVRWASNVSDLIDTVSHWWNLASCEPEASTIHRHPCPGGVGLLFTGGVDSFFSLLEDDAAIDTIVQVQGFDIPNTDRARLASSEEDVRSVAEAMGVRCVVVRSNLRTHPAYLPVSWERTHGGALLSVGHLLRGVLREIVISSSAHRSATRAWGSDRRIDCSWSSNALTISHRGADWWRYQKLEQIADHPQVRDHLRVCWEHRSEAPNCSECEKCLRTMITLNRLGALESSTRFDNGPIAERIERLDTIPGLANRHEYGLIIRDEPDDQIAQAVSRLIARSREKAPAVA